MTAADLVPAAEAAWFTLGLACLRSRRLDPARAEPALAAVAAALAAAALLALTAGWVEADPQALDPYYAWPRPA